MKRIIALLALAFAGALPARGDMVLTQAAKNLGFSLSTFAAGFPSSSAVGPLGIVFLSTGQVMVSDYPGNLRVFAADVDNQTAPAPIRTLSFGNAHALATVGNAIYMNQKFAGTLVQINADGTLNQTILTGLNTPLGMITNLADGHLFVSTSNGILDVDPLAKTFRTVTSTSVDGVTLSPDSRTVYGASGGHILGFDTTTGALTFDSGVIPGAPDGTVIGVGPLLGNIYSNNNDGTLWQINLQTKVQTLLASGGSRGDFVSLDPNNGTLLLTQTDRILRLTPPAGGFVPEPAAHVQMALGLAALGGLAWRRWLGARGSTPA